MFLSCFST